MSRLLVAEFGRKSRQFSHFCPDSFHKSVTRYIQMRIIPEKFFQLVSIRWNICIRSRVSTVICGSYTQKKARFYLQPNQKYGFCTTRKIIKKKKEMSNLPTIRCAKSGCDDPENTLMFGILDCRGRGTLSCVSSVEFFVVEVNDASAAFASSPDKFWLPQILFVFVAATVNEWYWLGIKFFVHEIYAFLSLLCSLTFI